MALTKKYYSTNVEEFVIGKAEDSCLLANGTKVIGSNAAIAAIKAASQVKFLKATATSPDAAEIRCIVDSGWVDAFNLTMVEEKTYYVYYARVGRLPWDIE